MSTETRTTSKTTDWLIFLVSTVVCLLMLVYMSEWFWLALPFVITYLVKALDKM